MIRENLGKMLEGNSDDPPSGALNINSLNRG